MSLKVDGNEKQSMLNTLVADSLEYYDFNNEKYESFFKNVDSIQFEKAPSISEHHKIIFFDSNKNVLATSRYENLGIYSQKGKIWTWAWSIPTFEKNSISIAKKILNYGIDIPASQRFLKNELIISRFKISNSVQIDIHAAIAMYLSKQPALCVLKRTAGSYESKVVRNVDFYSDSDDIYYFLIILDNQNLK